MAPYSMGLRTRVLQDWDEGTKADAVAAKYRVSRAWVHRVVQRRRETGEIEPRRQTRWRTPMLDGQTDRTLVEIRAALHVGQSHDDLARGDAPRGRLPIRVSR